MICVHCKVWKFQFEVVVPFYYGNKKKAIDFFLGAACVFFPQLKLVAYHLNDVCSGSTLTEPKKKFNSIITECQNRKKITSLQMQIKFKWIGRATLQRYQIKRKRCEIEKKK